MEEVKTKEGKFETFIDIAKDAIRLKEEEEEIKVERKIREEDLLEFCLENSITEAFSLNWGNVKRIIRNR